MAPLADPTQKASAPAVGDALAADWAGACRRMVAAQRDLFQEYRGIAVRTVYEGMGEGGDRTLEIDRLCEEIVFEELDRLHAEGHDFTAISEERGEVALGDGSATARVVIDPIDGSLNARRTIPAHSLSVAVTSGPTMADGEFGYVYDFGADEEYVARRNAGATLNGEEISARGPGYGLEVVAIEAARPERSIPVLQRLAGKAYRMRVVGSIAISLCYVAAGRADAMLTCRACRSVDAAAGQVIAREAGAEVAFAGSGLDAPLELDARYHVAAGLDRELLEAVLEAQASADPAGEEPR